MGVAYGGTDAVMAGHLTLAIPPEQWDGVPRWATSEHQEDEFLLQYLVSHTTRDGRGIPIELDRGMTPPINLVLDGGSLRWEYIPDAEDDPIDGYLIYFNDNVVWEISSTSRSFALPAEWQRPVCDVIYNFSVGTVIGDYPDSRESPQSNVVSIETDPADCRRQVRVTFLRMETFAMPGDGHHEDRTGDVGPIYGQFFVNARSVDFSTGILGPGLDTAEGWTSNTTYDLVELEADGRWNFSAAPVLIANIGHHGDFQYAYGIMDVDSGRCHDSDDPGCDDLLCSAVSADLDTESELAQLDAPHDVVLRSDNNRCELTVRIEPTGEGAVGASPGNLPFPLIWPVHLGYDEQNGTAEISFINQGSGAWPNRDLEIDIQDREGSPIDSRTLTNYNLGVNAEDSISVPLPAGSDDYCVVFDPNNLVPEQGELNGSYAEYRSFCRQRPDLSVEDIRFNRETSTLEVTVTNTGEGEVENRTLEMEIAISGESNPLVVSQEGFSIGEQSSAIVNIPLTDSVRNDMMHAHTGDGIGYVLTLNQNHSIGEEDYDNNRVEVAEARGFAVGWVGGCSEAVVWGMYNHFTMTFSASVGGDHIYSWNSPEHTVYFNTIHSEENTVCWGMADTYAERQVAFLIMGDERLSLRMVNNVSAVTESYHVGTWEYELNPNLTSDFMDISAPYYCNLEGPSSRPLDGVYEIEVYYPGEHDGRPNPGTWYSQFHICRVILD